MPRFTFFAGLAAALLLTACSSGLGVGRDGTTVGSQQEATTNDGASGLSLGNLFGSGPDAHATGYAVGDEPYAVKAAADILAQGGNAADAATAAYFTMAVTYPGAAGLGGGGLCVVYDPASQRSEAIDFLARDAAAGGAFAVPGNVRGFATLQGRYGALPWQRDVAYAEALAATGFPISDALAARLKAGQNVVRLDAGLAAEFLDESGQVKGAGTIVSNPGLATTLTAIRENGAAGFYRGAFARKLAAYAPGQDGAVTQADLASYRAQVRAPQLVRLGGQRIYLPSSSVGAGSFAAAVMAQLAGPDGSPVAGRAATLTRQAVQAAMRKFGVGALPGDLGATGFAALDRNGQAVACAVTMNGPFGSGHTVPGTGVTLANSPAAGQTGLAAAFLTPVIAAKDNSGPIRLSDDAPTLAVTLAGAGAGGPEGTAAIAEGLLRLTRGVDTTKPGALGGVETTPYDTVNAIACQHGICAVLPDARSHGLGAAAGG